MAIGDKVKALRTERGWTQAKLSELCGIAASQLCRIEQGSGCSTSNLKKLAKSLGVTADALLKNGA